MADHLQRSATTGHLVKLSATGHLAKACDLCPASVTVTMSGWTTDADPPYSDPNVVQQLDLGGGCGGGSRCSVPMGDCCYDWSGSAYDSPEVIDLCYDRAAGKWYFRAQDFFPVEILAERVGSEFDPTGAYTVTSTTNIQVEGTVVIS
jgi:hypothetical protein